MALDMNRDGSVKATDVNRYRLATNAAGGFSLEEVLTPNGALRALGNVRGKISKTRSGLHFRGGIASAGLELDATFKSGQFIDVRGEVRDLTGADRALRVKFTLPICLAGWKWENTAACSRVIKAGKIYPSAKKDFLYLGKKGDGFADEDHAVYDIKINKLPYSCVTRGKCGLAIAYPLHEPRVFLIEASDAGYSVTFSLGLSPITAKFPSRASFRFILFPIDPKWGIRSACERYQSFFPKLFKVRCTRHGNNSTVFNPEKRPPQPHMADMGYATLDNDFQWSDWEIPKPTLQQAEKIGVGPREIYNWRGPWYSFHEAPGDITRDEQLALMKAQAEGRAKGAHGKNNQLCGCPDEISAQAAYNSCLEDEAGKLNRVYFAYPGYSCWLLPMNMDPNLPEPNRARLATEWQFRNVLLASKRKNFRGPFNCAYDAFDDFSGFRRLNFRREHLAVMDIPATFDPVSGRLCQIKGFHDWAWAREHTRMVHQAGGKILANVNLEHSMMFGGQFIDFIERERNPRYYDEERLSTHRMLLGAKPIAFCGGKWLPTGRAAWIAAARKLLAFGMPPGPKQERWKELREHMPLVSRIAAAGWQPIPHAVAPGLWIERFGRRPGRIFLALRNPGRKPIRTTLRLDLHSMGVGKKHPAKPRQVSPEAALRTTVHGGRLTARVAVQPRETVVMSL
jgi:hypothetical protein